MNLRDLQRDFSQALRRDSVFARIVGPGLGVYRNNYRAQLHDALADTYKHLHLWLGEAPFTRAADAHIDRSQPHSWTLDHYGQDFSVTLSGLFPNDPEIVELALLDLAMANAFVAADAEPVAMEGVGAVDWQAVRFRMVPSLSLSQATTNAAEIWDALEHDVMPPAPVLLMEPRGYVVWRLNLVPRFRVVQLRDYRAIAALHRGMSFGDVCEIFSDDLGETGAAAAAGGLLRTLFDDELVAEIIR